MSVEHVAWALSLRGLDAAQRLVLLPLAHHADKDGVSWPSVATLAAETGLSERHVQRQIALLERPPSGPALLTVERGTGRGYVNRYRLLAPSLINKGDTQVTHSAAQKGDNRRKKGDSGDEKRVTDGAETVTPESPNAAERVTSAPEKGDTGVTQNRKRIKRESNPPLSPRDRPKHVRCVYAYFVACGDATPIPDSVLRRYVGDGKLIADSDATPQDVHDCTKAILASPWFAERRMRPKFATVRERLKPWIEDGRPPVWREPARPTTNGRVYAGTGSLKAVLSSQGVFADEARADRAGSELGAGEADAGIPRQLPRPRHDQREAVDVA